MPRGGRPVRAGRSIGCRGVERTSPDWSKERFLHGRKSVGGSSPSNGNQVDSKTNGGKAATTTSDCPKLEEFTQRREDWKPAILPKQAGGIHPQGALDKSSRLQTRLLLFKLWRLIPGSCTSVLATMPFVSQPEAMWYNLQGLRLSAQNGEREVQQSITHYDQEKDSSRIRAARKSTRHSPVLEPEKN